MGGVSIETSFWTSYYITGDEPGKKKSPHYEWSAVK